MYAVTSWPFFAVCAGAAAASLASFDLLSNEMLAAAAENGFAGDATALQILDLRGGYSAEDVGTALGAWGAKGRALYLAIEAIDVTAYMCGYRGAFLVLMNRLAAGLAGAAAAADSSQDGGAGPPGGGDTLWRPLLGSAAAFACGALVPMPVVLAWIDGTEGVQQVGLTLWYSAAEALAGVAPSGAAWEAAVAAASGTNMFKWGCVRGGVACMLAAAAVLAAAVAAGPRPKPPSS
ncbi:hypothetical protein HYH03_005917 [Edaphochlamys debaryana]|uniref:Uncharacterized protein n=1 Tax=Edaphochlamys debaryana TaxID=47281 RepID=A0A835Y4U4_9CHLO|nr:hypothetical protein HYH03_005917 [Edaphochlamys debaryana]|eukprot:KAG2495993.1 hypothetical protein HYH03_005917 [Edaphochlamys debaryana]